MGITLHALHLNKKLLFYKVSFLIYYDVMYKNKKNVMTKYIRVFNIYNQLIFIERRKELRLQILLERNHAIGGLERKHNYQQTNIPAEYYRLLHK